MIPDESAFEGNASYIQPRVVQPADTNPWITSAQRLEEAIREARAQALEDAAREYPHGRLLTKNPTDSFRDWLRARAATERADAT